jgi:hypothetical protein
MNQEWIGRLDSSLWASGFKFDRKKWLEKSCDREVDASNKLELESLIPPMSDLYTSLHISPKKKRFLSDDEDDTSLTPKRLRPAYVNHLPLFRRSSSDHDEVRPHLQSRADQTGPRLAAPLKPSLIPHFLRICHDSSLFRLPCNMLLLTPLPHPLSPLLLKLGFCEMW